MPDITQILEAVSEGDPRAAERLLPAVYDELRQLAERKMAREPSGHTLQATALVHEAYLRIAAPGGRDWNGRGHFFAAAAEAMRRILIERARAKSALKRGGDRRRVELDPTALPWSDDDGLARLLDLDEALSALAEHHPEKARLVEVRYFAGLDQLEAAEIVGISKATADRHWAFARAWLFDRLEGAQP